jgi:SAM-dependent methyltransferase
MGRPTHTASVSRRAYLRRYLDVAPISLALFRAAEAAAIGSVALPRPLLDVGCGFGEFGGVFFQEPADVGLDVNPSDVQLARQRAAYRNLVLADGRRLPFVAGAFASVLSVSVVEHIERAEYVITEAWRVLRPGGVLVFTTPSPDMGEKLLYPRLLRAGGLGGLGRIYARTVDRFFHHVSLKPKDEWVQIQERVGFRVREAREIIPPRLTAAFDLTLPGALPSQLGRLLRRGRWVWRPPGVAALCTRLLGSVLDDDGTDGCNLFFVADKP